MRQRGEDEDGKKRRTSRRWAPGRRTRYLGAMRGAVRRRARLTYRRDLLEGCGLRGCLGVGSARREVVWMKESLGGGLRVMSMGRVSAGRTRATVDNIDKLGGLAFRTAERNQGGKGVFLDSPRDGPL